MILNGFVRGAPTEEGLYTFQTWNGNVCSHVVWVFRTSLGIMARCLDGLPGSLEEWMRAEGVCGYRVIILENDMPGLGENIFAFAEGK